MYWAYTMLMQNIFCAQALNHCVMIDYIYYILSICSADAEQMLRAGPQPPHPAVASRPQLLPLDVVTAKAHRVYAEYMQYVLIFQNIASGQQPAA